MSDRDVGVPTLETRMDDIRAVLDAVGSERAVLFGLGDASRSPCCSRPLIPSGPLGWILMNASPRFVKSPSLPWLPTREETQRQADDFRASLGDPAFAYEVIGTANPSAPEEELKDIARVFRLSVSPGAAAAYIRMNIDVDVCGVLPLIRVPTLVMHRKDGGAWDIRSGRYMAEHIPGARFVELPGADFSPSLGEQEPLFAELESFLADVVAGTHPEIEPDRVLATVLFSDIVGSSEKAAALGDRAWRELLLRHHELVRRQLVRFRGQEVDTAGDGFFASFDGPARAIRCGCAIAETMPELGLEVRVGLHTGECELVDGKVAGIAVHTGARVAANAQPGEVLVSSTVRDLVAGSGLTFEDRGSHELKGIPGEWRLWSPSQRAATLTGPVGSAAERSAKAGLPPDVTVFRLNATAVGQSTPERPFLRNAAERVDAFEAATSHFRKKRQRCLAPTDSGRRRRQDSQVPGVIFRRPERDNRFGGRV